jgi:GWxTD domain-containing protein
MKNYVRAFISALFLCSQLYAQAEMSQKNELKGPDFHYDVVNVAVQRPEGLASILHVYIEVFFDELQFVKIADGYEAKYEASVVILDKDNDQVDGKVWQERVFVNTFDKTNSRELYSMTNCFFSLEPGTYKFSVSLLDQETQFSETRKQQIEVRDFSKSKLSISDISFASNIVQDSSGINIFPQVTDPGKGLMDKSQAYFEIYNFGQLKNCAVTCEIFGEKSKKKITRTYTKMLEQFRTPDFFPIQVDSLAHDAYRLIVSISNDEAKAKVEKKFYIRWKGLPSNAKDLDDAIDQVRYIATRDEWKKLKNAKAEKRLQEFQAFWKRHDPTPNSEYNEAMEAHYARVEYANEHFSVMQREGWRTDMGLLYILLGAPDDVQRNAYPLDSKPYEVWYYYRINREFLFYDSSGFGDYRFATPYSIYEIQRYAGF